MSEIQRDFSRLFAESLEVLSQRDFNHYTELHNAWVELLVEQKVSPPEVVQAVEDAFSRYGDDLKLFLLSTMRTIVTASTMFGGYAFPEFFWIAVRSNVIFEISDVSDVMSELRDFSDLRTLRAFLTYRLMTGDEIQRSQAVRAFYYVGFTADALRLVLEVVAAEDMDLCRYIYATAMSTLFGERAKAFSEVEKRYFHSFFERGLEMQDEDIEKDSRRAIEQLQILGFTI